MQVAGARHPPVELTQQVDVRDGGSEPLCGIVEPSPPLCIPADDPQRKRCLGRVCADRLYLDVIQERKVRKQLCVTARFDRQCEQAVALGRSQDSKVRIGHPASIEGSPSGLVAVGPIRSG